MLNYLRVTWNFATLTPFGASGFEDTLRDQAAFLFPIIQWLVVHCEEPPCMWMQMV